VDSGDFFVEGGDIDLFLDTENLIAVGDVKSRLVRKQASGAKVSAGALFTGSDPIIGTAARLDYRKDTGTATYTGAPKAPASLQQGDTRIFAIELVFEEGTNELQGKGDVDSRIPMTVTDDQGRSQVKEQRVRADAMSYDDALRRAEYRGQPVILTTVDGVTEGQTMVFEFGETARALKRLRAMRAVFATRSDGHEFSGTDLDYLVDDDLYILTGSPGNPAAVKQPARDPKAVGARCDFTEGQRLEFSRRTGGLKSSGPLVSTEPRACTESLRKSR
jgi:lipopolysaccharide export system protein LptA